QALPLQVSCACHLSHSPLSWGDAPGFDVEVFQTYSHRYRDPATIPTAVISRRCFRFWCKSPSGFCRHDLVVLFGFPLYSGCKPGTSQLGAPPQVEVTVSPASL